MTQEDKKLLIKDLCARLPYGIKVGTTDNDDSLENIWKNVWDIYMLFNNTFDINVKLIHCIEDDDKLINISEVKPYLLPLSSMTEEQKKEYNILRGDAPIYHYEFGNIVDDMESYDNWGSIDYLNANHFDYRGLIEKGLAIDATGLNIY